MLGCAEGVEGIATEINFVSDLSQPGRVPVEINLTIDGQAILPDQITGAGVNVACAIPPVEGEVSLGLSFSSEEPCVLPANREDTLDVQVEVSNLGKENPVDLQGWSYSVRVDHEAVECIAVAPGPAVAALNGGEGPEFLNYKLDDRDIDGTITGISVGAVVQLGAPGTEVLSLDPLSTVHLDSITLRSLVSLVGDDSRDVELSLIHI